MIEKTLRQVIHAHQPLMPSRVGFVGEHVFLRAWHRLLARNPGWEDEIFYDLPLRWNSRASRVAASFAKMLGTNWGLNFLHQCRRLAAARDRSGYCPMSPRDAYLAAWAIENRRVRGMNSGLRSVEAMLAEQPLYGRRGLSEHALLWERVPVVGQDDLDVIECMVTWLSTVEGDAWARKAERLRSRLSRREVDAAWRQLQPAAAPV